MEAILMIFPFPCAIISFAASCENRNTALKFTERIRSHCSMGNSSALHRYVDDPFYPTDDNFYENTVVVVMSVSGEQRFLFKQVQGLKKGGATIISITNSKKCRLAEAADYSLAYYIPMIVLPGLYNVTSSIPVVYILEKLAHDVSEILKNKDPDR